MYKLINLKYVTLSIVAESEKGQGIGVRVIKNSRSIQAGIFIFVCIIYYLRSAPSTATATATVAPTIGLLPIPIIPIISTCAGTDDEPAN